MDDYDASLADDSIDSHWRIIEPLGKDAVVDTRGGYVEPLGAAKWVAPSLPNTFNEYWYVLEFDLSGFQPETALISGATSADGSWEIYLNDQFVQASVTSGAWGYAGCFQLSEGFLPGKNQIRIKVLEPAGNHLTGLLVQGLHGTAALQSGYLLPVGDYYATWMAPTDEPVILTKKLCEPITVA